MSSPSPDDRFDVNEQWAAWTARCAVSHHGHFAETRNTHVAFHRPATPLSELRVALLTSGGANVKSDSPFDMTAHAGDDSVRWIPGDVSVRSLRFAHDHYDHTDPDRDPNCMFSIDRLRELAASGTIENVAPWHVGFMGFIPKPVRFARETIPQALGLMQNALETAGIATVSVSMVPYLSLAVGVPRALYARFPFGTPFGEPGDGTTQRAVLESALRWLHLASEPNRVFRLGVSWRRSRSSGTLGVPA